MAKFIVRVQLREESKGDYEKLHDAMEKKGFNKTIRGSDSKDYHLPHAEYFYEGEKSESDVLNEAYAVAAAIRKNPAVLLTSGHSRWRGLEKVKDEE